MDTKQTKKELKTIYKTSRQELREEYKAKLAHLKAKYNEDRASMEQSTDVEQLLKIERKKFRKDKHKALNEPPVLGVREEIGNAVTHGLGTIFAIVVTILMLVKSNTAPKVVASVIYGVSLAFMFLMSCLYHSFKTGSRAKRLWRRFDYSSIYLLIGGTFAPLYLVYWGNTLGLVLIILQWILIVTGITMVGVFGPGRLKWLHFPLYFLIGWSGLIFIPDWITNCLPLLWTTLGGGLVYTIGMIPFVLRGKKSAHFIWHIFVLLGAIVQWLGIFLYVY